MANMMQVYLDHNATTPPHREVVQGMLPYLEKHWGNASSLHAFGRRARQGVESARESLAALIGCAPEELIFTAGGTEADNMALFGVVRARRGAGNHIVTSAIEHHAVLNCVERLAEEGFEVTYLPVDRLGRVRVEDVREALRPETILVSIMYAKNEMGAIQPIAEIGRLLRERKILVHCDAVQAVGKIPVDVEELGVDLLALSGHKFHGPKGVGALYVRKGVTFQPLLYGGAQEEGLRPSTYNVPAIVGMGIAAEIARRSLEEDAGYVAALRERLEKGIMKIAPEALILGEASARLPNTINVCFPGEDNQSLIENLDLHGVAVSTGAACSAGSQEPSHVLAALGIPEEHVRGAVRFSLGSGNSEAEIDYTLQALQRVLRRKRSGRLAKLGAALGVLRQPGGKR